MLVAALCLASTVLLMAGSCNRRDQSVSQASAPEAANQSPLMSYPTGWPDARIVVPPGSTPSVARAVSKPDKSSDGKQISRIAPGVSVFAVGFSNPLNWEQVCAEVQRSLENLDYHKYTIAGHDTFAYESKDKRVVVHLAKDAESGPYTMWITVYTQ
jgi:hypothetical protein